MIVVQSSPYAPPPAAPQSGMLHGKQPPQVRPLSGNFPAGMPAQFVSAPHEALNRELLPVGGNQSQSRMVSPRPRRVISPRPCYSWRSQYSQQVLSGQSGLPSHLVETGSLASGSARLPSSRYAGVPATSNAAQSRTFKPPTRARTPELQTRHRDRQRVEVAARALQVQPARSVSTERSLSSDRLRTTRHAAPARPRTISPEERVQHMTLTQSAVRQQLSQGPRIARPNELPAREVQQINYNLRAWLTGGGDSVRTAVGVYQLAAPCEGATFERTPPPAKERSSSSPAAGSTNRSRSCSPSTVPRVLSGSGSPMPPEVVDVTPPQPLSDRESFERSGSSGNPGSAARLALGLGTLGSGPGFHSLDPHGGVHVDNPELLNGAPATFVPERCNGVLMERDPNSPGHWRRQLVKEVIDNKDGRKRPMPLNEDEFSTNAENICSPLPALDLNDSSQTSISFNLSPIKAPMLSGGGGSSSVDLLRGALTYSDTISTGFSLPTSSRVTPSASGAPSLLPSRRESPKDKDKENQANTADAAIMAQAVESPQKQATSKDNRGSSERALSHNSKVFELISMWEQQTSGGSTSTSSSRRRGSRPSAAKRSVSSPCCTERARYPCCAERARYLGQKEAITLRAAQDLLKRISSLNRAGTSPRSSETSFETQSSNITESPRSETNQDSPTKKARDEVCKQMDDRWKLQRRYMRYVQRFVMDCEGAHSSTSSSAKSASIPDLKKSALEEDRLPFSVARGRTDGDNLMEALQGGARNLMSAVAMPTRQESLEATLSSLPALQCLKPDEADAIEGLDAREALAVKSPTAPSQPEEEADGPLPGSVAAPVTTKGADHITDDTKGEDLQERGRDPDGTRHSTTSTLAGEPAVEPQPLESPRPPTPDVKAVVEPDDEPIAVVQDTLPSTEGREEPSICTEPEAVESPEGRKSRPRGSLKRTSVSEEEPQEGVGEGVDDEEFLEEDADDDQLEDLEEGLRNTDGSVRATEDGMDRTKSILHHLECFEMKRDIKIIVPDGVGPDRRVSFKFQGMNHEIILPEGYDVGAEVAVTLTKRPFLERNPKHGHYRGHAQEMFPDRMFIFENLRHSPRTNTDNSRLYNQVFKDRYYWYTLLKGLQGCPLLEWTPEEREEDLAEEVELS